jgi:hypothetical protein
MTAAMAAPRVSPSVLSMLLLLKAGWLLWMSPSALIVRYAFLHAPSLLWI